MRRNKMTKLTIKIVSSDFLLIIPVIIQERKGLVEKSFEKEDV